MTYVQFFPKNHSTLLAPLFTSLPSGWGGGGAGGGGRPAAGKVKSIAWSDMECCPMIKIPCQAALLEN